MRLPRAWIFGFGMVTALAPVARADEPPRQSEIVVGWEAVESLRGYTPRSFLSDGTEPAVSKGRERKAEVHAASLESPIARCTNLTLPRMPHGFLDPTHPAGPAEPGSAAPAFPRKAKPGPYTSGFAFVQIRR